LEPYLFIKLWRKWNCRRFNLGNIPWHLNWTSGTRLLTSLFMQALLRYIHLTAERHRNCFSWRIIMAKWCLFHHKENFLIPILKTFAKY
jgi:hypothetical protein